jgi:nitrogen-specific signal transduction histidine kinase
MTPIELLEPQTTSAEPDGKERHYAEAGRAMRELSHALKNILQMVGGAAEVIDYALQVKQMDKVEKSWGILSLNVKRLKKSLLDILDFAKKQPLDKCECDINEELKRTLNSLKWIVAYKKFKVQVQLDAALPQVEIDPERIGLMTLNLLLHAIDQVADNDGLIRLQTSFHPQQNQFAIRVTDNSPAYSPALQQQLFTPHETHQQRFSTGIGIVLAQQIASQHGGRIELTCADGANTLTAILPVKMA